jgi:hypothetical protein
MKTFESESQFKKEFAGGLLRLAKMQKLGAFILVTANGWHYRELGLMIGKALEDTVKEMCSSYHEQLSKGPNPNELPDVAVLREIIATGWGKLRETEYRSVGTWVAQFNIVRSFRPRRAAREHVSNVCERVDFSRLPFHFDKDFVQDEKFGAGDLEGRKASLFYNMFPFANAHAILVLEPKDHHQQILQQDQHQWAWVVAQAVGKEIPCFGMGYNSLGAYASVRHLHWQTFIEPNGLPVMHARWRHNDGTEEYPLPCRTFFNSEDSWEWVEERHQSNTPYNLIYLPGRIYCFERRFQNSYEHACWTSGFAWYECGGGMITSSEDDFDALTSEMIFSEFVKMRIA